MDVEAMRQMFTTLPVDIVATVLFATAVTVDTLRAGASRAIAVSISLLLAHMLYSMLPTSAVIGVALSGIESPYAHVGIYAVLTLALTVLVYRMTSTMSDESSRPLFAIITGAATAIVVLTVWQMSAQLQTLWHFNDMIRIAFGEAFRLYWLLLAFVAFAVVKS